MIHIIDNILAVVSQFALDVIQATGYFGVFILSFLESAAIPIPSEVVVPFAGFLASQGVFTVFGVTMVASLANLGGSILLYWIGASGGRWILERYGRYVFITSHELEIGDKWFYKHGIKTIFWGRMLPVVRTFISLPAGVTRMKFWEFSIFTFLGALPWNWALAYVGFKAGENWEMIHDQLGKFNYLIAGAILALIIWFLWTHLRKR